MNTGLLGVRLKDFSKRWRPLHQDAAAEFDAEMLKLLATVADLSRQQTTALLIHDLTELSEQVSGVIADSILEAVRARVTAMAGERLRLEVTARPGLALVRPRVTHEQEGEHDAGEEG